MAAARLVGVGASAGGVETLLEFVAGLGPALDGHDVAVLLVLHQPANTPTVLPTLLGHRSALAVEHAEHGTKPRAGCVYVAPPDRHLLVVDGEISLSRGPRENGHRPSIDATLRSLALDAGPGAVGVILSGMLDDGASGLLEVVRHGGGALVQDPEDALYDGMPLAALAEVPGAVVRPLRTLAAALAEVLRREVIPGRGADHASNRLAYEVAASRLTEDEQPLPEPPGPPAGLVCPDCSGPLFDLGTGRMQRFRCRVGHAWSQASLVAEQDEAVERALYIALRALEDKAALQHRVAASAETAGAQRVAANARHTAHDALESASALRALLAGDRARYSGPEGNGTHQEETPR